MQPRRPRKGSLITKVGLMPNTPVTRGDVAVLASQVGQLQQDVHGLLQTIKDGLAERPTNVDIKRDRHRFIVWALIVLLASTVLTVLTFGAIVSRCFLVVPNGAFYTICSAIPGYTHVENENKRNLEHFHQLLAQIPKNHQATQYHQQEIVRNRQEIDRIKADLRRHGLLR